MHTELLNHRQMRITFCQASGNSNLIWTSTNVAMQQLLYGHNVMNWQVHCAQGSAESAGETVLVAKVSVAATPFSLH